jgi:general secretion pathway protein G
MRRRAEVYRRGLKTDAGYTLTEMLVVLAIIGLIAAVLTPGLIGQLGRARSKTAQMQLDTVAAGVEMYRTDVGHYPTGSQGIQALLADPGEAGWNGPYVKDSKILNDPWGHPVQYQVGQDGQSFTVTSLGRDGQPGGTGLDRDLQAPAPAQ